MALDTADRSGDFFAAICFSDVNPLGNLDVQLRQLLNLNYSRLQQQVGDMATNLSVCRDEVKVNARNFEALQ